MDQVSEERLHQIANGCWLRSLPWTVDCQPATVRKHREMNPRACDAIEVLEPDDGGLLLVVPGLS